MKPTALVYLRDDPAAQRMVVAWPLVPIAHGPRDTAKGLAAWAAAANVSLHIVGRLSIVLRLHEIVLPDGTVAPDATNYIAALVSTSIPRRKTT